MVWKKVSTKRVVARHELNILQGHKNDQFYLWGVFYPHILLKQYPFLSTRTRFSLANWMNWQWLLSTWQPANIVPVVQSRQWEAGHSGAALLMPIALCCNSSSWQPPPASRMWTFLSMISSENLKYLAVLWQESITKCWGLLHEEFR